MLPVAAADRCWKHFRNLLLYKNSDLDCQLHACYTVEALCFAAFIGVATHGKKIVIVVLKMG